MLTGVSAVNPNISGYYDRKMLVTIKPLLLFSMFANMRPVPAKSGTKFTARKFNALTALTAKLTDGVNPTAQAASVSTVTGEVSEYGGFVKVTSWLDLVGLDNNLLEINEALANQAALTWDTLDRDELLTGTNVRYANAVAGRTTVASAPAIADIKKIIQTLEGANAKPIKKIVAATEKYATRPIRPSYVAITHTNCRQDYEALDDWTPAEEYASYGDLMPGEMGSVKGIRVLGTTNAKVYEGGGVVVASAPTLLAVDSTNIDVYTTLVFAENAFASIPVTKQNIKNIVQRAGGVADPLEMYSTSGWKFAHGCVIQEESAMLRFEHGCTSF